MKMPLLRLKNLLSVSALCATGLISATSVYANDQHHEDENSDRPITVAVIGDWPYNKLLVDNAHLLIDFVNADIDISQLIHVGDIHFGSMPCTSTDILPPIPQSNPGYNQKVYFQFQQFNKPVIYTPGDNEWTDCQKSEQCKSGDPLKELASVRSQFFAKLGLTLGKEALADPSSSTGSIYHTQSVPNLTRVTVQESTTAPSEWLRLTIDTRSHQPFSWENVAYFNDPLVICQ